MIAHLETQIGWRSPALSSEDQKNTKKGKGSTFPGLMQMAVQDFC